MDRPDPDLQRRVTAPAGRTPSAHDRPFTSTRFKFDSGVRSGETASIRNGDGQVVLTHRGFASAITIVAALVAGIVIVAGIAAALFLVAERRPGTAVISIGLSIAFSTMIAALVPRTRVTLYDDANNPALVIDQHSRVAFPRTTYAIKTPDGATIALLGRSVLSRLGRNSWSIDSPADQRGSAFAVEESFWRAVVRKAIGKFDRSREANLRIYHQGVSSGVIVRRPDQTGEANYLDLSASATLDRRVAVALATLVFGAEP